MADAKRGRLRSVSARPMYDEKGKINGHTVSAEHEAAGNGKEYHYLPPVESPHESMDSAMAKVKEHLDKNHKEHGKATKGRSMREAIGSQ
jgi:hypothetical protein